MINRRTLLSASAVLDQPQIELLAARPMQARLFVSNPPCLVRRWNAGLLRNWLCSVVLRADLRQRTPAASDGLLKPDQLVDRS